ncbi:DNA-directed RNA polymerase I subunit RPA12-like [Oppia nitens]|uniref:DNA-directed RNA polymerase I subunit RPA12-like n=1 Tax=Oppia nitens TaxID=1686743 RepID=UPI0023DBF78A|nr:DNA-directed RNA polymerase I subunit RPA12-like [Oppia nitens]
MSSSQTEFCHICGTILPLPLSIDIKDQMTCLVCNHTVDVNQFNGITSTTRITFNTRHLIHKSSHTSQDKAEGPVIERKCQKCGHEKQTFATLQTRSADEGQTVFYTCLKCGAQENENS